MNPSHLTYRKIEPTDRLWIDGFIKEHWGSKIIIVHNTSFIPSKLDGYIACRDDEKIGLITFQLKDVKCEIVSLNSVIEHCGVGSSLVKLVEKEAKKKDCKEIWVVTTNDNLRAIGFYQKIGYQLVAVFPNAVEQSRKIKPEIPLVAKNKIPIRDELIFKLKIVT